MMIKQYVINFKKKEAVFVICTMAVTLLFTLLSAYFKWGSISAFFLAFCMFSVLSIFAFKNNDLFLKKLLIFGLAAGFTELVADYWLVEVIESLEYPETDPKLLVSPLYMPFAWSVILIQVGYLGWIISISDKIEEAMLVTLVLGMCFIPIFEHFAKVAEWWYYNPCKMIFNTPWYIIFGEGLIAATLPLIFRNQIRKSHFNTVFVGLVQGIWIFMAYFIGYQIIEKW